MPDEADHTHEGNDMAGKCATCGAALGWDRPSGVCSEPCLKAAQGFITPAAALVGAVYETGGGHPAGNRWDVVAADGDRVQVVRQGDGVRYWWNYRSLTQTTAVRVDA